jgi:hypothetical protein
MVLLLSLCFSSIVAAEEPAVAYAPMPKETSEILRSAVIAATKDRERDQKENLDALDKLARTKWPQVSKLQWVHLYPKEGKEGEHICAWKVSEDQEKITLIASDLTEVCVEKARIGKMEPADFKTDLSDLIQSLKERKSEEKHKWDFYGILDYRKYASLRESGPGLEVRLACAALEYRLKDEAKALIDEALRLNSSAISRLYNMLVWQILRPAMFRFQDGGSRKEFLATCKKLLADYPGSEYDKQLESLIKPLEREAATPQPDFLKKKPEERTQEENIRYWIYQLRDLAGQQYFDPGYPDLFSPTGGSPTAADQLVAFGMPAIPYLIEALDDDTPTRTIGWGRSWDTRYYVLHRQDVAVQCLEKIVGCLFYSSLSSTKHLHEEPLQQRKSIIENISQWWQTSKGSSQAQMIRNQFARRGYDSSYELEVIAMLDGPEAVIKELHKCLGEEGCYFNSSIAEVLNRVDPHTLLRAAFTRFWGNKCLTGDYIYIYKYGDKKAYEEVARRFQATGKLDTWFVNEQLIWAAKYGKNWAIPIVAKALEMEVEPSSGGRADVAAQKFQELTCKDFGYAPDKSQEERCAAVEKARKWWLKEGRESLADKIAEEHPPVIDPGDLFWSDEQIQKRVAAIESKEDSLRRKAVASLGLVCSYKIQRALLNALEIEKEPAEKVRILDVLGKRASLWHLPTLVRLIEHDTDTCVRLSAAKVINQAVGCKETHIWWYRLKTRDLALDAARRLAQDEKTPLEVRYAAAEILMAWGSFVDQPLLRKLATDPAFKQHTELHSYIQSQEEWLKRFPPPREMKE